MRTIIHLFYLLCGFAMGIYVGVHFPRQAAGIDKFRADEQARIQPQLEAVAAKAKVELLSRLLGSQAATMPAVSSAAAVDPQKLLDELRQAQQTLNQTPTTPAPRK